MGTARTAHAHRRINNLRFADVELLLRQGKVGVRDAETRSMFAFNVHPSSTSIEIPRQFATMPRDVWRGSGLACDFGGAGRWLG